MQIQDTAVLEHGEQRLFQIFFPYVIQIMNYCKEYFNAIPVQILEGRTENIKCT